MYAPKLFADMRWRIWMAVPATFLLTLLIPALQSQERTLLISDPVVQAIAQLRVESQQIALRALLAGNFQKQHDRFRKYIFYYQDRLRPSLCSLLADPRVGQAVSEMLA